MIVEVCHAAMAHAAKLRPRSACRRVQCAYAEGGSAGGSGRKVEVGCARVVAPEAFFYCSAPSSSVLKWWFTAEFANRNMSSRPKAESVGG